MSSLKDVILEDINRLSQMSVQEYTLWRKWTEIQAKFPKPKNTTNLFFNNTNSNSNPKLDYIKSKIWMPSSSESYKDLQPKVIHVKSKEDAETWEILRIFTHSGRFLYLNFQVLLVIFHRLCVVFPVIVSF